MTRQHVWFWFRGAAVVLGLVFAYFILSIWINTPAAEAVRQTTQTDTKHSASKIELQKDAKALKEADLQIELKNLEGDIKSQNDALAEQKDALAVQKDETGRLTDYAKSMMLVVGVFTILFGAASWKSLEDQRKATQEALEFQITKLQRFRDELQLDFPMLGRIQSNFRTVLVNLRAVCESLELRDDTYSKLKWKEKQEILFYENAITTALLLNTKGYEKELSEIYGFLGDFYGSRFFSAVQDDKFESNPQKADFERARFYFDRAIELDQDSYAIYMHAGHFTQYYDNQSVADLSKKYFDRAAKLKTSFQKPFISIALIELEAFSDPDTTLSALEKARQRTSYDPERGEPRVGYIAYLEACAYALKAKSGESAQRVENLRNALARLNEAFEKGQEKGWSEIASTFAYDRSKYFEGDDSSPNEMKAIRGEVLERFDKLATLDKSPVATTELI